VIGRGAPRLLVPAVTVAVLLALTGCGKLGAQPGTGSIASSLASSSTAATSAGGGTDAATDAATLNGITQDLDSADAANGEAGSNAAAGDQAAATGDEP